MRRLFVLLMALAGIAEAGAAERTDKILIQGNPAGLRENRDDRLESAKIESNGVGDPSSRVQKSANRSVFSLHEGLGPRPLFIARVEREDCPPRVGAVEGLEVDSGDVVIQEIVTLLQGEVDADAADSALAEAFAIERQSVRS